MTTKETILHNKLHLMNALHSAFSAFMTNLFTYSLMLLISHLHCSAVIIYIIKLC